ncbi:MAG: DEAD/DEAH box helicase, partial [Bacilli bacterium]
MLPNTLQKAQKLLNKYFGYSTFREGQERIISSILQGKDTLGIMPTGGGKSICYQIPALMLPGTTLVISPLISLMKDQVDALSSLGIPATFINSS